LIYTVLPLLSIFHSSGFSSSLLEPEVKFFWWKKCYFLKNQSKNGEESFKNKNTFSSFNIGE